MVLPSELGIIIGTNINDTNSYKQDFIETEDVADINLVGIETVELTNTYYTVKKKFITGCANLPFVIDHVVHGDIDSAIYYLDGDYCSTTTFQSTINYTTTFSESLTDSTYIDNTNTTAEVSITSTKVTF